MERLFPAVVDEQKAARTSIDHNLTHRVSAVVSLFDRLPPELLTMGTEEYTDYITNVETVRSWVPVLLERGSGRNFAAPPLRQIYLALQQCPDQFPAATVHDLPFITNNDALRDAIRLDIDNAERALVDAEWKAATVMGGAAIEALLLWKLTTLPWTDVEAAAKSARNWKTVKPLDEWHLPDYIEVAAIVPVAKMVITANTLALLRVVKNYRNLIHPGAAIRTAEQCDKRTAHAAIAGVAGVVADLSR
jgi:hypothetical protein